MKWRNREMKKFMKLGAVVLAIVMVLSMSVTAFASGATTLSDGVAGAFSSPDTPANQTLSVNIVKTITGYNANTHDNDIHAPAATYTYTVEPAVVASGTTVTDSNATSVHASGTAVTVPVKGGITTGLIVTGTSAGTAGSESSAVGTLVFTNTDTLSASSSGTANNYNINLDFSNVDFTEPGVYRYKITEAPPTYASVGLTEAASPNHVRYLDVYVKGTDGNNDDSYDIYGYVCMTANESVTTTTNTKTSSFDTDAYYTYDLTISKTVVGDDYGKATYSFPFTVIFNNQPSYTSTFTITETATSPSTGITPTAASAPTWSGVARVKDGSSITYTGIPCGVDVDVYETNIATGVMYKVDTSVNSGTATTDNNVTWSTAPTTAVAQETKGDAQSTKATVDTTINTAVGATQTISITNTLMEISPTGVALRVAPYALMLGVGLFLVLFSRRRKNQAEA